MLTFLIILAVLLIAAFVVKRVFFRTETITVNQPPQEDCPTTFMRAVPPVPVVRKPRHAANEQDYTRYIPRIES